MAPAPAHCFVSGTGELLPRWKEAFPRATSSALSGAHRFDSAIDLVWLHLPHGIAPGPLIEKVRAMAGPRPVVVLSDLPDDEQALQCFTAGAKGYCNAHSVPLLLRRVADVALQGGLWIGESLMTRLLLGTARLASPFSEDLPKRRWQDKLSAREIEVATEVADGASNKEIARRLGITERTVKAHVGAILNKLGVTDRLQLSLVVHGRRQN